MKWLASLAVVLTTALSYAGFDGYFVVASVQGRVEVRAWTRDHGLAGFGLWRAAKVGEVIRPKGQARTLEPSRVWLQSGAKIQNARKMRRDEMIDWTILAANSWAHTFSPGKDHKTIETAGQVLCYREHGKLFLADLRLGKFF